MSSNRSDRPPRLRGWLLLLSRLLIVWHPLNLAVAGMSALNAVEVRGLPVAAVLVLKTMVTAIGIAAGIALSNRRAGAIALAKVALLSSAATDLFVYTTPYFPNNRLPGDTTYYLALSMAYHGAWLLYLFRSRQARELL